MGELEAVAGVDVGELAGLTERAQAFVDQAKAPATLKAYRSDWANFSLWCRSRDLEVLPASPNTVVLYLTDLASVAKAATIRRRLSSISQAHQAAGLPSPTKEALVRACWAGIRRSIGVASEAKTPAVTADVRAMVGVLQETPIGTRDRALLLLGFAGAFRRSELVAIDVEDLQETGEGLVVNIQRSKTDQEGAGRKIGIPYGSHPPTCPVRAVRAWRETAGIAAGALFRSVNRHGTVAATRLSDKAVALVVKRSALAAGLDPASYAGHSLRSGLATAAAAAGVGERAIMAQTGHTSLPMLRHYIRDGSLFRDNAAASVGL